MDQRPLVTEEIDAGADLVRAFDQRLAVKAAFWLKASDEDYRHLYIASDAIDVGNLLDAYLEIGLAV